MIEPMSKVHFLFLHRQQAACLADIGRTKLVHLDGGHPEHRDKLLRAEATLKTHCPEDFNPPSTYRTQEAAQGKGLFKSLEHKLAQVETLSLRLQRLHSELAENASLGQFDPQLLSKLSSVGLNPSFYKVRAKDLEGFGESDHWFPLFERNHKWVVVVFSAVENPFPKLVRLRQPRNPVGELRQMIADTERQIDQLQTEIQSLSTEPNLLFAYLASLKNQLQFSQATGLLCHLSDLCSLSGFAPTARLGELRDQAKTSGFVLLEEPTTPGEAPTLLKQNRFTKLFNPILRFVGVTPGTQEPDASGLFLVFFSVFFALLVGDAGYGGLMVLGTLVYRFALRPKNKQPWGLYLLLGTTTTLWGAMTGVWFGVPEAALPRYLTHLVVPMLNSWSDTSALVVIKLTFILGWVQLSLAHGWKILRADRWSVRFTEFGWLLFLGGLFDLASYFVLQEPLNPRALPVLGAALGLVILFGEQAPGLSWGRGVVQGVFNLPLNLLDGIGQFSDLVSYIRLFAVGLATKEMAVTFNQLAMDLGFGTFWTGAAAVGILLLGHWINLALVGIAVMVHGIRLNFLECAKHLGLEWTGRAYRPFEYNQTP